MRSDPVMARSFTTLSAADAVFLDLSIRLIHLIHLIHLANRLGDMIQPDLPDLGR